MTARRQASAFLALVLALVLIAWVTLTPAAFTYRAHTLRIAFDLSPTHLEEDFLNAILFAPLGVAAAMLGLRALRALLLAVGVSLLVETLQFTVVQGRFAELQDVVANGLGGLTAWWIARRMLRRSESPPHSP